MVWLRIHKREERREERKTRSLWVLEGRRNQTIFEESDDAKLQKGEAVHQFVVSHHL